RLMSTPSLLLPRPPMCTTMMRCTMPFLSRSRLVSPTSLSFSTTPPPPSTMSTTAGERPTTSWMDLTRLSSPLRPPSRSRTARTSVSSGRSVRLPSLSASPTRSRPTRPSRPLRKSRRSSRRPRLSPSSPASRRLLPRTRSLPPRPPPLPPPLPRVRLSSSTSRRM
ncbi:MAG: hypothetical protein JOS17DRAFT_752932, partial [Linnemannia elongata]